MKLRTLLICGTAMAGLAISAFAGEDSTDRWHGVGPAYYETQGGLRQFAECAGAQEPQPAAARDCATAPVRAMHRDGLKKMSKDATRKDAVRSDPAAM